MLALELAGVNIVLLHFAPQGGAADIEQLRHLLHPPAGHPGGVNNSFLSMALKSGWPAAAMTRYPRPAARKRDIPADYSGECGRCRC